MRRAFSFLMIAALVVILPAAALGQSGIVWDSDIVIQNVGTAAADVTVYYYNNVSAGGGLNTSANYTVPLGGNIRISPLDAPAGFNGSVVIESTEPIAVIVNEMGDPATYSYDGAYEGFEMGSDLVRLAGVQSCNANLYSFFNVQNAGSESTTVTVDFIEEPGKGYASRANEQCTLGPGEACTFSQEPNQGQWPADCGSPANKWVGGARITTNNGQPVVSAINMVHQGDWGLSAYSGFTGGGSPTAVLINAVNANADYWTGIGVTNAGTAPTTITLTFFKEERTSPPYYIDIDPVVYTNVQPNDTVILLMPAHPDLGATTQWVGSVLADGGGQNILAVANTLNTVVGESSAVKGVDPNSATTIIDAPAVLSDDATHPWWSGLQVYNTEDTQATVDIVFSESLVSYCGGTAWTPAAQTGLTIPPKQSIVRLITGGDWAGKCYFGSATITSTSGHGIIGLGGHIAPTLWATGEVMNYYNAMNR